MNLFDVTRGFRGNKNDKPRTANDDEIFAYAHWLRISRCLPNFPGATLRWRSQARGADSVCVAVTFGGDKETGAYSLLLPGYASHRDKVTFETLGDDGEPETSQTLPVEPKKGGVIWDREAVRKACGPIAKPAKAKRSKVAQPGPAVMPAIASPAPVQEESVPIASQEGGEAVNALHGQEIAPDELLTVTQELPAPADEPAPATVNESLTVPAPDLDAITARLDALEAALATLSAEKVQVEVRLSQVGGELDQVATPTARAKRTAAHERAIRRAWQERAARRAAMHIANDHMRMRDQVQEALRVESKRADGLAGQLDAFNQDWIATNRRLESHIAYGERVTAKRRQAMQRARRMIAAVRARADMDKRALSITNATLSRLKRDMADPMQPERASDIARLVGERDTARTALAAMAARAERAEQTVDAMADRFEGLVSRVTRAEAALRQSQAA